MRALAWRLCSDRRWKEGRHAAATLLMDREMHMNNLAGKPVLAGVSAGADWRLADHAGTPMATAAGGMNRALLAPYVMLALALVGIADAFYDSYAIYAGQLLWCPPPIDGCNVVANSPYARIVGVPLGYLGLVFYLYMFGLAALLAFDPFSRGLRLGALLYAALGVCSSIYFMYVQLTFIHAFCIYCAVSAVLTLLLLISALMHFSAMRADS
jgi:uncharacterized membrane protein